MTSVNLKVTGVDTFGARLPTVFFTKIEINDESSTLGASTFFGVSINTEFNIKFTKPAHLQNTSTEDFIKNQINDLKLYGYVAFDTTFISELENEEMSILAFQKYIDDNEDAWSDSESDVSFEVPLRNLIDPPETEDYGASLILNNSFDEKGDEIIEIAGISHVFKILPRPGGPDKLTIRPIGDIPKVTLLAMVGLDRDLHQDPKIKTLGFSDAEASALDSGTSSSVRFLLGPDPLLRLSFSSFYGELSNNTLYNKYFGNISYINVLEFGEVPSQFYKQFSRPDGTAYLNLVMQSINGKFYSTDNYSFNDIQNSFKALFDQFNQDRETDSRLNKNMSDLEAIVYSEKNKTNVLGEIANYRSTYPNKEQNTASGRFYNSFIVVYAEVLQNVHAQDELTQKLYFDSLIVDSRGIISGDYEKPSKVDSGFSDYSATGWVDAITYEDNYIPYSWFNCTRTAHSVENLTRTGEYYKFPSVSAIGDDWQEALLESALNGLPAGSGDISSLLSEDATGTALMDAAYSYANDEYEDIYNYYYSNFVTDYPEDVAAEMAAAEVEYVIGSGDGTNLQQLENAIERSLLASDGPSVNENFVVHNTGWWLFDYEKAIRYKSRFSQYIDLSKMQRYFRYNIPYNNFKIMGAQMQRREMELPGLAISEIAGNPTDPSASFGVIHCTFFADFIAGKTEDFKSGMGTVGDAADVGVMGTRTYYTLDSDGAASTHPTDSTKSDVPLQIKTGLTWKNVTADAMALDPLAEDVHKFKYMRPAAKDTFYGELLTTHLKFKLFDLANSTYSKRFEGINDLGGGASPDAMGPIYDGYRLACFEFSDLMDDDVAYYNGTTEGQEAIGNPAAAYKFEIEGKETGLGAVTTVYRTGVKVEDSTLRLVIKVLDDLEVIVDEYADYVESAIEVCSFNNITNSYNSFFVGAINEKYLESKPWVKAAYYSIAYLDIFYGAFGDAFDSEEFDEKVLSLLMRISPETGNLDSTTALLAELRAMINDVKNQILNDIEEKYGIVAEDIYRDAVVVCFGNIFPIAGPLSPTHHSEIIYGDYFPFSENDASYSTRAAAPLVVIPEAAYFGGAYAEITTLTFGTPSFAGDTSISVPTAAETATSFDLIDSGISAGSFSDLAAEFGDSKAAAIISEFYNRLYAGFVGETAIRQISADNRRSLGATGPSIVQTGAGGSTSRLKFDLGFDLETSPDAPTTGELGTFEGTTRTIPIYDPTSEFTHKIAFDEIFMPFSVNDWRFAALGFRFATDDAGAIISGVDDDYGTSAGPAPAVKYPFQWGGTTAMDLAADYSSSTYSDYNIHKLDETAQLHTSLARFAHEMLQRSTTDAQIFSTGGGYTAQARNGLLGVNNRRNFRNLGDLLALIQNVYLPEAQRRISNLDDRIYSNITRYRQRAYMLDIFGYNAESGVSDTGGIEYFEGTYGLSGTRMDYVGTDRANVFSSLKFQNNIDDGFLGTIWCVAIREMLLTMQDIIIDQMNAPDPEGPDRAYATRGISKVVNKTDYPGVSSFVSPLEAPPDYDYSKGTGRDSDIELFGFGGTSGYMDSADEIGTDVFDAITGGGFIDVD